MTRLERATSTVTVWHSNQVELTVQRQTKKIEVNKQFTKMLDSNQLH